MKLLLIRYGELALKGKNRKYFEEALMQNIRKMLHDLPVEVKKLYGRLFVYLHDEEYYQEAINRLQGIFGLVSISPAESSPLDFEDIKQKAVEVLQDSIDPPFTFKVEARRSNKQFPLKSPEINQQLGGHILKNFPQCEVDVHNPDITLKVEIREQEAYLFYRSYPGEGGLPVGISGKALLLLSGGIDSPIAGWMGLKRGLEVEALHFHSFPFTSERSKEKVIELAQVLTRYHPQITLHIAGFTEIQKAIHSNCPKQMGVTIMRRMMFRVADRLCRAQNCKALITGESLGQVASQTLESIQTISATTDLPVFRPLIGLDKQEIISYAQKIGTYPISIQPYEDCCTVFVPRHPAIKPKASHAEEVEQNLDIPTLLENCMENIETITLQTPR